MQPTSFLQVTSVSTYLPLAVISNDALHLLKSHGFWAGKLVGDVLLAAAFVSYAGPFNMEFRKRLVTEKWLPDLTERQIPLTTGFMPLDMLADESSKVRCRNFKACTVL